MKNQLKNKNLSSRSLVYLALALGISVSNAFEQIVTLEAEESLSDFFIDPSLIELQDEKAMKNYNQVMDFSKRFLGAYNEYAKPEKMRETAERIKLMQYVEIWDPFTVTTYYDYTYAFVEGLALDNYYRYSTECFDNLFYAMDDYFYFLNNLTLETNPYLPFANFTAGVAQNISEGVGNCFLFGDDAIIYTINQWDLYPNGFTDYLIAFLFTQMGNAQTYINIFDAIEEDLENQNYEDIWHQYGRLINNILDVSPIESQGFQEFELSDEDIDTLFRSHDNFEMLTLHNSLIQTAVISAIQWAYKEYKEVEVEIPTREEIYSMFDFFEIDQQKIKEDRHWHETHTKIPAGANHNGKVGSNAEYATKKLGVTSFSELQAGTYPSFVSPDDIEPLAVGILEGMVNVFESDSYVQLCEGNITDLQPTSTYIADYWADSDYENCMDEIHDLLVIPYGIVGNCYLIFAEGLNYDNYYWLIADNVWVTNIVFNIGYIYNDILSLIILDEADDFSSLEYNSFWYQFGFYIGDMSLRFLYTSSENHLDRTSAEDHEHDID